MRVRVAITAAVLVVAVALVARVVAASGGGDTFRPPWENADGTWDLSKRPATENVVDHTGTVVGVVETRHDGTDLYPLPVLGPDGADGVYMAINYISDLGISVLTE